MVSLTKKNLKLFNKRNKLKSKRAPQTNNPRKKKIKIDNLEEVKDESLLSSMINSVGNFVKKIF